MFRKFKARIWARKITRKNIKQATPINCEQYIHPTDKAALIALKKIPLFDTICSKALAVMNEPQRNIIAMSSKIRITEQQIPKIYYMVQSICTKIGIDMPLLYLELNRQPNAYTEGTEQFSITIHSGLLECVEDDELYAILAHECGHIACKHVLYQTMGRFILEGGSKGLQEIGNTLSKSLVGGIVTATIDTTLRLAYFHWERCSELSADRVAAICCESPMPVIETMMRLAGGTTHIDRGINRELFIEQAVEYRNLVEENKLNKALEYCLTYNWTHPLLAVRAYEIREWAKTEDFAEATK